MKGKFRAKQKRLDILNRDPNQSLSTLDDYLLAGNQYSLNYFKQNKNPLRKLWEYHGLNPKCGSHSTYTYAAFLSLTQEDGRVELQDDVRWVGGIYIHLENKKGRVNASKSRRKIFKGFSAKVKNCVGCNKGYVS